MPYLFYHFDIISTYSNYIECNNHQNNINFECSGTTHTHTHTFLNHELVWKFCHNFFSEFSSGLKYTSVSFWTPSTWHETSLCTYLNDIETQSNLNFACSKGGYNIPIKIVSNINNIKTIASFSTWPCSPLRAAHTHILWWLPCFRMNQKTEKHRACYLHFRYLYRSMHWTSVSFYL